VPSIRQVTVIVERYDVGIAFFVDKLGFDLVEDTPSLTSDGRQKRWVVVRPPGAATGLLLAEADNAEQLAACGNQVGGRVGFIYEVEDFDHAFGAMVAAGVHFEEAPRVEPYGKVAVFNDISGNRWDLIGPV
jgi:catechol 2,3-dioxygenase-like lactoylglutathione lyase family enzyme